MFSVTRNSSSFTGSSLADILDDADEDKGRKILDFCVRCVSEANNDSGKVLRPLSSDLSALLHPFGPS